ncbi:MAG TPA: lysozyme inhibitor LprI family protein [Paraburkholderia sp.]
MKYPKIGILFMVFISVAVSAEGRNYSPQFLQCSKASLNADSQANCITNEIVAQKKRLNITYANLLKKLPPEDRIYLDKIQHEWIAWRDDNYNFLAEHVSGSFVTTRATSLDFLLRSVFDRANELEVISNEMGSN